MTERIIKNTAVGRREVVRPRSRKMDGVLVDIKRLKIVNWWAKENLTRAWIRPDL